MKKIIKFLTQREFESKVPDCLIWLNLFFPIDLKFDDSYVAIWFGIISLIVSFLKD